jgi:hypothetical protein
MSSQDLHVRQEHHRLLGQDLAQAARLHVDTDRLMEQLAAPLPHDEDSVWSDLEPELPLHGYHVIRN